MKKVHLLVYYPCLLVNALMQQMPPLSSCNWFSLYKILNSFYFYTQTTEKSGLGFPKKTLALGSFRASAVQALPYILFPKKTYCSMGLGTMVANLVLFLLRCPQ